MEYSSQTVKRRQNYSDGDKIGILLIEGGKRKNYINFVIRILLIKNCINYIVIEVINGDCCINQALVIE